MHNDKITWVRPDGREIVTNTNEANVKYAVSLGWEMKRKSAERSAADKIPTRRRRKHKKDVDKEL